MLSPRSPWPCTSSDHILKLGLWSVEGTGKCTAARHCSEASTRSESCQGCRMNSCWSCAHVVVFHQSLVWARQPAPEDPGPDGRLPPPYRPHHFVDARIVHSQLLQTLWLSKRAYSAFCMRGREHVCVCVQVILLLHKLGCRRALGPRISAACDDEKL